MGVLHVAGIGKMGLPMAGHFQAAGHAVTVSDPGEDRLQLARSLGLQVAADSGVAMASADMIFSSLPHDAALRQVAAQVAQSARRGAIYIDTSTVSQQASAGVAQPLADAGVAWLRCTVSGNNKMAEAAQLTVMASGPRAAYDAALPLLKL
ncbi:MAG: NAD(P)-dependent oxidoreductase, partial [Polaromonas sp.]|nr:NAD(P)-dependent oxidoreductase [Polaromonas sp.]